MTTANAAPELDRLFEARHVALIGASANPAKWGAIILANIRLGRFEGEVLPVNPREPELQGYRAYSSVEELPADVDLAVIAVPARVVQDTVARCGRHGIPFAIVISAGFREAGNPEAEVELVRTARENGIRLVGPNTMGIFSGDTGLHALMPPVRPPRGSFAFLSQSGNIGSQTLALGGHHDVGFRYYVSSGNEADLQIHDYLRFFAHDPDTRVVGAYVEGVREGRAFLDAAAEVSRRKPLIVYKSGQSDEGARAASSHCGALASSPRIFDGVLGQVGAVRAEGTEHIVDFAKAFLTLPLPAGPRIGIMSWGGGWGVVTTDLCRRAGLEVPTLDEETLTTLDGLLPAYWPRSNPVDLVGSLDLSAHMKVLEAIVKSPKVDAVMSLGTIGGAALLRDSSGSSFGRALIAAAEAADTSFREQISALMDKHKKPIIGVSLRAGDAGSAPGERLVVYTSPERGVRALAALVHYQQFCAARGYPNGSGGPPHGGPASA